jgi:uncharacterized damage-inducible protein DinB
MSTATPAPPQNPAGEYVREIDLSPTRRTELIAQFEAAPVELRKLVSKLSDSQLDTLYKNWSIRQITHHLADSHCNSYIRFKVALTEVNPTIKPYDETKCSELPDAKHGPISQPLALLEAVHARHVQCLKSMTNADFSRTYFHPESNKSYRLDEALNLYAWHSRHHTAQIKWIIDQKGW